MQKNMVKYRTIKFTLFFVLLTIIFAVTSACFYSLDGRRVTGREGLEEAVFIYLEEKYGNDKNFRVIQTAGGGSTGIGMRTVYLSSNELPEDTLFLIKVDNIKLDNNKYGFEVVPDSDNYTEILAALPIRDEMLKRLNSKYKREFIPLSFRLTNWLNTDDTTYTLTCYPMGGDADYDYTIVKGVGENSTISYQDTFFGNIIRNEIEAEITALLSSLDFPYIVTYRVGETFSGDPFFFNDSFDRNNTLVEFKSWLTENDPEWYFEVDIVIWVQFKGDNDRGYWGELEPYEKELYELLSVLEHEYRFNVGVVYKEDFSEEMRAPTNLPVYLRSDMRFSLYINSDLEH